MKGLVLLLVLATAVQPGRTRGSLRTLPGREGERRLCGWKLANELNRVCKGVYNKPTLSTNTLFYRRERGEGAMDVWPLRMKVDFPQRTQKPPDVVSGRRVLPGQPVLSPGDGQRLPFLSGTEAMQVVGRSRRAKRGLSAECCRKACTVSELAGYCY